MIMGNGLFIIGVNRIFFVFWGVSAACFLEHLNINFSFLFFFFWDWVYRSPLWNSHGYRLFLHPFSLWRHLFPKTLSVNPIQAALTIYRWLFDVRRKMIMNQGLDLFCPWDIFGNFHWVKLISYAQWLTFNLMYLQQPQCSGRSYPLMNNSTLVQRKSLNLANGRASRCLTALTRNVYRARLDGRWNTYPHLYL